MKIYLDLKNNPFFWVISVITLLFVLSFAHFLHVRAATPLIINYQGRLEDSSGNLLGGSSGTNFDFKFSIWNSPTVGSGTQLWPASGPASTTHKVTNGVFDARIGDTEQGFAVLDFNFNTSSKVYLQIEVWNTTSSAFETLAPRQPIVSTGFAINANTLDGARAGTSSNNVLLLDSGGNINLPAGQIRTINTSSCSGLTAIGGGAICYDTSNNNLFVFNSASSSWVALGGSSSTGSSLQQSYDIGNVITTSNARDIRIDLADTATDSNFIIRIATSSTGAFLVRDTNDANRFSVTTSTATFAVPVTVSSSFTVSGGAASLQGLSFTSASGTNISVTGYGLFPTLNFTNASGTRLTALTSIDSPRGNLTDVSSTRITAATSLDTASVFATNVSSTNISVTGYGLFPTLNFTNASGTNLTASGFLQSAGTLAVTGQTTLANASTSNLEVTGANYLRVGGQSNLQSVSSTNITASGYLSVSGVSTLQGLTFTNATGTGNLQAATINVTGVSTLQGLTFTNATGTGNLQAGSINNTPIGGTTPSTAVFTNATTTGTFTSQGAGRFEAGLTVSAGQTSLQSASGTNIEASGYGLFPTLIFTNASGTNLTASGFLQSAGTLAVTGQSTLGSASTTNLEVTGANYLRVGGVSQLQGLTFTNATGTGNLQAATINVTGVSTLQGLTFTNATGTGNLQAGSINNTPIGGTTPSTAVFTNATTTGTFTSQGAGRFEAGLTVSAGQTSLQSASGTNIEASGYGLFPTLIFTNASGTNLTASGFLQSAGTLAVTGQSTLGSASTTNLEVTGANYLRVGGVSQLQGLTFTNATGTGNLQAATINVTGVSTLQGLTFTNATGTGNLQAGSINNTPIGGTTPSTAVFTNATTTGTFTSQGAGRFEAGLTVSAGQTSLQSASGTNIEASGYGRFPTLNFTNASGTNLTASGFLQSAGTLAVTGQSTLGSASTTNLEVTGANYLRVGGVSQLQGLTFTNATGTGNLQAATINTTGLASLNSAIVTGQLSADILNATTSLRTGGVERISGSGAASLASGIITGTLSADIINATTSLRTGGTERISSAGLLTVNTSTITGTLQVFGLASSTEFRSPSGTITTFVFTNASGTRLTALTSIDSPRGNLTDVSSTRITAATSLDTASVFATNVSSTNISVTGYGLFPTLNFTNASGTNLTASGFLQSAGTLAVTGQTTLGSASTTNLEVTGTNYLRVGGVSQLQGLTFTNATGTGNLQAATINTTGLASLNSAIVTGQLSADILNATTSLRTGGVERISGSGAASLTSGIITGTLSADIINATTSLRTSGTERISSAGLLTVNTSTITGTLQVFGLASSTEFRSPSGTITTFVFTNASGTNLTASGYLQSGGTLAVSGQSSLASVSSTNLLSTGYIQSTLTGDRALLISGSPPASTSSALVQIGPNTIQLANTTGTFIGANPSAGFNGDFLLFQVNSSTQVLVTATGTLDIAGIIQAGSSNVNLTLATGFIDADAITLTTAGTTGSVSSNSGLEVVNDGLTLLKGCGNGQILKWNDTTSLWECAADASGGAADDSDWNPIGDTLVATTSVQFVAVGTSTGQAKFHVRSTSGTIVTFITQATSSQTANLLEARDNSNTVLAAISATGTITGTAGLTISGGQTSLQSASTTNISVTGYGLFPTLNFTTGSGTGITTTNTTTTGNLNLSYLQGSSARCLEVGANGNVTSTGSACGSGGGADSDWLFNGATLFATTSVNFVAIGTSTGQALLHVRTVSGTIPTFIVQATSSQTANLLEARDNSNAVLAAISATGTITGTAGLTISSGQTSLQAVSSTNFSASGFATIGTTLNVSGQTTLANASTSNLEVTGANYLRVGGVSQLQGLTFTNATGTGNLQAATINVTGVSTLQGLTFTNATGTGNLQAGSINNTPIGGTTPSTAVFTNATTTGTFTSQGAGRFEAGLTVSAGQTSLQSVSGTNIEASGYGLFPTLNFTNASGTNLTASGFLQSAGTLAVTGQSSLASVSSTNLLATGYIQSTLTGGRALIISGSPPLSTSSQLIQIGPNTIQLGSVSGTFIGANPATPFNGDFINFQVNSSTQFAVSGTGTITAAGGLSVATISATNVSSTNISATGYGLFPTLNFTNASGTNLTASGYLQSAGTLAVSGQSSLASVSSTNLLATGYLNVSGNTSLQALTLTSASGTNIEASGYLRGGTLNISGQSSLASVTSTNLQATGYIRGDSGLTITSGQTSLQSATGTNIQASGYLRGGTLTVDGQATLASASGTNIEASGYGRFPTLNFTNASGTNLTASGFLQSAGTLAVTGQTTLGSASTTNLEVTGTNYLRVGGVSQLQGLTFTNATGTGNLQAATINVTGVSTLQGLTFTNATGTGNLQAGSINNTPIGGTTPSTAVFTNATTTGTFTSQGAGRFEAGLTVSAGQTSLQSASGTNIEASGYGLFPTLNFTNASGTNLTASGFLQSAGTLAVTGQSSLASVSSTNLLATGYIQSTLTGGRALIISGSPPLSTSSQLIQIGPNTIQLGSVSGTFIGANPATPFNGDFINFQVNSSTQFAVSGTGTITAAGGLSVATISATNVSSTNISATGYGLFPTLNFTNASGTNLTASGYLQSAGTLAVSGQSSLASVSSTNLLATGYLNVSGNTSLQALTLTSASGTNIEASGYLRGGTLNISGQSSLASVTSTNLQATGYIRGDSGLTITSGQTSLQSATGTNIQASGYLRGGTLTVDGQATLASASGTNIEASGYGLFPTLNFTNASGTNLTASGFLQSAGTLAVTGQTTLGSASTTNLEVTGANYLRVGGVSQLQGLTFTNATGTGNLQAATINVTGVSTLQGLTFTNATGTGNLQAGSINNTPIGGTTPSTAVFTNATTTGTFTSQGAGRFEAGLTVSAGQTSLQSVSGTNIEASGYGLFPTLNFTNASGTNLTASGFLQSAGTLAVTGQSSLASVSSTNLLATGYIQSSLTGGRALLISGSPPLSTSSQLIQIGPNTIQLGSASGTFIGANPATPFNGDFINFQVNSSTQFAVSGTGTITAAGGLSVATISATNVSSTNISATGYGLFPTLNFTNASGTNLTASGFLQSAGTLAVTGQTTLGSASTTNLEVTGANYLRVGGVSQLQGLTFTNATGTGNLQAATINVTGVSTLQGLTFTNATGTGNLQAGSINNTPIGGTTPSTAVFTNATTTGTFTSQGAGRFEAGLTVSAGQTTLQSASGTNIQASGYLRGGTLTVDGQATLASASGTNIEASGYGRFPTLIFTNASGTNQTLSGYLAVTGQTALGSASGTNISVTGYGLFPTLNFTTGNGTGITTTNTTTTGNLNLSYLQGSSARCLEVGANGNVTSTGSACGAGGGGVESGWRSADSLFVFLTTSTTQVGVGATSSAAKFFVQTTSVGTTTALFQGMAGQTADLFQIASSSGSIYFQVSALGIASSTEFRTASATVGTFRATGNSTFDGRLAVGTTTFTGSISIQSSTAAATGVAGIYQELTINPSVGGNFQFGDRMIVRVAPTGGTSTNAIGSFIRMIDDTNATNTVHALQVQAWSGTNNLGENTGIFAAGRTFGVKAITSGEAGSVAQPAALFAELRNATQGNAIRAYSATSTTANLVQFFHEASAFSGAGLLMNFGNGGGSFTGNFLNLQRASTTKFAVNASGTVVIGTSTAAIATSSMLVVCARDNCTLPVATSTVIQVASVDGTTATQSILARGAITGVSSDYGEYVPVIGNPSDYEEGDLLSISSSSPVDSSSTFVFEKSVGAYDSRLAGAVTKHAAFIAGVEDIDRKVVMALAGRIPVKVSGENGSIAIGDPITASSLAGHGMKATQQGRVLGVALEAFEATSTASTGKILLLINPHWYVPKVKPESLQGGKPGTGSVLNTFTFDDSKVYHIENLTVQNLEIGSEEMPTGFTLYDTVTKKPYCITIENGNIKTSPGKCAGAPTNSTPSNNSGQAGSPQGGSSTGGGTGSTSGGGATVSAADSGTTTATGTTTSTTTTEPAPTAPDSGTTTQSSTDTTTSAPTTDTAPPPDSTTQ